MAVTRLCPVATHRVVDVTARAKLLEPLVEMVSACVCLAALLPLCAGLQVVVPGRRAVHSWALAPRPRALIHTTAKGSAELQPATTHSQAQQRPALRTMARTVGTFSLSLLLPAVALASAASGEHLHLGQKVALFFKKSGLPDWAVLALISATPAIELRGGVPVGNWLGLSPLLTFAICIVGNMAPILPMLLALRSDYVKKIMAPLLKRAEKKLAALPTGQSRTLALALFVGVPAPGTGAWTGAIIAYLLDMPLTTAMSAILAGVVLAGVIMTILTLAGKAGALVALGVLVVGGIGAIMNADSSAEGDEPAAD